MPKRLKQLRVNEVSVVDRGAGEGVRIMLAKRGDKKRRRFFTEADELVVEKFDVVDRGTGDVIGTFDDREQAASMCWAMKRIAADAQFKADYLAQHGAATMGESMTTENIEIQKAESVIKSFEARVSEHAQRRGISKEASLLELAATANSGWLDYRQSLQVVSAQAVADAEPEPETTSPAYQKLMRKAERRAQKHGTSVASEFTKLYQQRGDLAAQDREFHVAKAAGAAT